MTVLAPGLAPGLRIRDTNLFGLPEEVERRYRERYIPAQDLYPEEARPTEVATIIVQNDNPARPSLRAPSRAASKDCEEPHRQACLCERSLNRAAAFTPRTESSFTASSVTPYACRGQPSCPRPPSTDRLRLAPEDCRYSVEMRLSSRTRASALVRLRTPSFA